MKSWKSLLLVVSFAAALTVGRIADAAIFSIATSVAGQASGSPGTNYVTFDAGTETYLGTTLGVLNYEFSNTLSSDLVKVNLTPDAKWVSGAVSGQYAAPWVTNNNNVNFGPAAPVGGAADTTKYLTSGRDGSPNVGANVEILFSAPQVYFGLLWGSIDAYNTLEFWSGGVKLGDVVGSQVTGTPNGGQGLNGSRYVNIDSDTPFDKVVVKSSDYAFEFDNVAYSETAFSDPLVPEPASVIVWLVLGFASLVAYRRRKAA